MPGASYNQAVHRANVWLADVTTALDTRDRHYSQRVLRTWLHALRDRLTVESAAKFGQQLPELLRGTYYDGWVPSRVPMKYNATDYVHRFATEALIPPDEVPTTASTVTRVISEHMSPGQVGEVLAELPGDLRATVRDGAPAGGRGSERAGDSAAATDDRINALSEAVRTLARGLEHERASGERIDAAQVARAARLAEEILYVSGR
jgi:uncharacterized protein (DUF2267 family)